MPSVRSPWRHTLPQLAKPHFNLVVEALQVLWLLSIPSPEHLSWGLSSWLWPWEPPVKALPPNSLSASSSPSCPPKPWDPASASPSCRASAPHSPNLTWPHLVHQSHCSLDWGHDYVCVWATEKRALVHSWDMTCPPWPSTQIEDVYPSPLGLSWNAPKTWPTSFKYPADPPIIWQFHISEDMIIKEKPSNSAQTREEVI